MTNFAFSITERVNLRAERASRDRDEFILKLHYWAIAGDRWRSPDCIFRSQNSLLKINQI